METPPDSQNKKKLDIDKAVEDPVFKKDAETEEKKKKKRKKKSKKGSGRSSFNLPTVAKLKTELELSQEQAKEIGEIYADYEEQAKAISKEIRKSSGEEKKALRDERKKLRKDLVRKIRKTLDADQKEKLKTLTAGKKKKKKEKPPTEN